MSRMLSYVEYTLVVLALGTMSVLTFANVLSRYFLNSSISYTEEITVNLFVLLTFVGASIGVKRGAHLGFTLIYDRLIGFKRVFLALFSSALVLLFFSAVLYFGIDLVMTQMARNRMTPALGWPQWIFTIMMPIGCLLCIIRTIEATVLSLKEQIKGEENTTT
ncbi:TRAP transporter small permease [Alkalihalobacillus sp. MEB130]|uniref:TRAP transporter small permease n=1 Tax=Alkalihalobacillus sp. MEB130 TaxID=2976704 RepID=UPI0028DEDCC2|nr:TRAP transporter small permease [Alkalihalobacillus sp. MEB130]MDT8858898.1 TRAP transporter small permease [Alkalihalobacillus sp. MEB130]